MRSRAPSRTNFSLRGAFAGLAYLCAALALVRAGTNWPIEAGYLVLVGVWLFGAAPGLVLGLALQGWRGAFHFGVAGGFATVMFMYCSGLLLLFFQ